MERSVIRGPTDSQWNIPRIALRSIQATSPSLQTFNA